MNVEVRAFCSSRLATLAGSGLMAMFWASVLDQQDAAAQPGLDIAGGDLAHLIEIVVQVFADRVALQIVVVQRERGEGGNDDEGGGKQNFMAEAQIFVHGLGFR